jgi:DNA-nicking Smr family endonuclease
MKKRAVSEAEKILFRETVEHSQPKISTRPKPQRPPSKVKTGISALDGNTVKKLKRGKGAPAARLDLHGLTQEAAHRALNSFLKGARKNGQRLVLVITGKGTALKPVVPRWLNQPEFAPLIIGIETAHIRHGGAGALYVYLRK